jgi:hypothetical protein
MSEANCTYVCSRGILKRCEITTATPQSSVRKMIGYNWKNMHDSAVVYIHGSAIPFFATTIFPHVKHRLVLVSGDCDETVAGDVFPSDEAFRAFIEDPRIIHWFSQNAATAHPKLTPIPIGMCYHCIVRGGTWRHGEVSPLDYEATLKGIAAAAPAVAERELKCYANFHFQMWTKFGADRKDAISEIPAECIYYEPARIDTYDTWRAQVKYNFVVSPHGGGYDCHRTWEALALGLIPIVRTSPMDRLFEGLPVVIVQRWSDITPAFLQEQFEIVQRRMAAGEYDMRRITLDYWMERIQAAASSPAN